jgi:hypothetical protein
LLLPVLAAAVVVPLAAPVYAAADGPPAKQPTAPNCLSPVRDDGYGDRGDLLVLTDKYRLHRVSGAIGARHERSVAIQGLVPGERLVGIDIRPANGQLYGVGSSSRLYTIDPATGMVSPIGPAFGTPLAGTRFGVDFNPTVDRLRIISDTGQNLRIDPTTGAVAGVDTNLSYDGGGTPQATGAAYTNSVRGATSTALYDIDSRRDTLVLQGSKPGDTPVVSPNTGRLFTVGRLGMNVTGVDGFDIVGAAGPGAFDERDYAAVAAVRRSNAKASMLVRIDLSTGKATPRAWLPGRVEGLTTSPGSPTKVWATTSDNQLLTFDRRMPGRVSSRPITGLQPGESLVGIDTRPASGRLYGVGSTNLVYVIDTMTAVATAVGTPFTPALTGMAGVDFNPVVDRIRVVTTSGQNLRFNPDTGALVAVDGSLAFGVMDANAGFRPNVAHAAYTNSVAGATSTVLYDIDAALDALAVQSPPNDGTLSTVASLRRDADGVGGFDIAADGIALTALRSSSATSTLWCVNLGSGSVTKIGRIGFGNVVTAMAVAPRG